MNELDSKKKKRKRSESYSLSSRSRSRSRSERKKSKKSKKKHSKSKSKRDEKRKRSKSKKTSKKKDKKRSRSSSKSKSKSSMGEMDFSKGLPTAIPPFMYPPMRPYMFDPFRAPAVKLPPQQPPKQEVLEQPPDKIVKDQNFLNSDEKLFDSIISNEMHLRSVFDDTQISEKLLGQTLYKSVRKFVFDPNTIIFDTTDENITPSPPKANEILRYVIDDLNTKKEYINLGNMSHIREQLYNYKNRLITEKINNI